MEERTGWLATASHFVHRHFLWLLLGSYALAAVSPALGGQLRAASVGHLAVRGESVELTLPAVLLASLLFSAGLAVRGDHLRRVLRRPALLTLALAANAAVPVALVLAAGQVLQLWHNPDEAETVVIGLALVAAMPVAGSSAGWAQRADADLALSLGLVLLSTLLSPLTTPAALRAVCLCAPGDLTAELGQLTGARTTSFLGLFVLLPSLLGVLTGRLAGDARSARAKPGLKLATSTALLVLCYANASACLPRAVADPDWDLLAVTLAAVVGSCAGLFASGWAVARLLGAGPAQQASLMFGLGMSNNGTGQVLASVALAAQPAVLLPVIIYNLVQHLMAAFADSLLSRLAGGAKAQPC